MAIFHFRTLKPDMGAGFHHCSLNHTHKAPVHLSHLISDREEKSVVKPHSHKCPHSEEDPDPTKHIPQSLLMFYNFNFLTIKKPLFRLLVLSSPLEQQHQRLLQLNRKSWGTVWNAPHASVLSRLSLPFRVCQSNKPQPTLSPMFSHSEQLQVASPKVTLSRNLHTKACSQVWALNQGSILWGPRLPSPDQRTTERSSIPWRSSRRWPRWSRRWATYG